MYGIRIVLSDSDTHLCTVIEFMLMRYGMALN